MNGHDSFRRLWHVWRRNWAVYRRTWKISFLPPLLEPLFYLLAFGVGLSAMVGEVSYAGRSLSYMAFIAPALIAINIMNSAFFENTYASFVRMYYQKTFDAMLATPLSLPEIILGEILWGATKSVLGTLLMLLVISLFGLLDYPGALLLPVLALLGGLGFGAVAMFFTGMAPNIESFNLPIFLFITPMFLFSGTFFPIENLPAWAQHFALVLPLTHVVILARAFGLGQFAPDLLWSILYLSLFCLALLPLAIHRMHRRLIR
ncbi:MAG: ABC transporter permease [Desulfuromonadales bacterium]